MQNLLEPVAFGKTLRLPLVVMLVTTAGTLLFGVLGATLAAPATAVTLRNLHLLAETGLFSTAPTPPAAEAIDVPSPQEARDSLGSLGAEHAGSDMPAVSSFTGDALRLIGCNGAVEGPHMTGIGYDRPRITTQPPDLGQRWRVNTPKAAVGAAVSRTV